MTMPNFCVVFVALAVVLAGCSGRNKQVGAPDPELTAAQNAGGPWLCLPDAGREGWDCDNDPAKVANPGAYRPPAEPVLVVPAPVPEQTEEAVETLVPLTPVSELEAGVVDPGADDLAPVPEAGADLPEPVPPLPPLQQDAAAVPEAAEAPEPSETTATLAESVAEATDTPPLPAAPIADGDAPRYQRLAYQPPQPVSLLDMPPGFYAVQLTAMRSAGELERFFRELDIEGLTAAEVERDGSRFYVLLLGIYESFDRAQSAATELPAPLDQFDPWIRRLGTLQAAMLRAQALPDGPPAD
ncbi:MAG: SPOR domain-containing protein [Pseudomonadota bacterium]